MPFGVSAIFYSKEGRSLMEIREDRSHGMAGQISFCVISGILVIMANILFFSLVTWPNEFQKAIMAHMFYYGTSYAEAEKFMIQSNTAFILFPIVCIVSYCGYIAMLVKERPKQRCR